ncbi:MAG: hypothetical protein ACRC7N_04515 [Clostridium sp.]
MCKKLVILSIIVILGIGIYIYNIPKIYIGISDDEKYKITLKESNDEWGKVYRVTKDGTTDGIDFTKDIIIFGKDDKEVEDFTRAIEQYGEKFYCIYNNGTESIKINFKER